MTLHYIAKLINLLAAYLELEINSFTNVSYALFDVIKRYSGSSLVFDTFDRTSPPPTSSCPFTKILVDLCYVFTKGWADSVRLADNVRGRNRLTGTRHYLEL